MSTHTAVEQLWEDLNEAIWVWAHTLPPAPKRSIYGYIMSVHPMNADIRDRAHTYATALCEYLISLGMHSYYSETWFASIEGREILCVSVEDHQWHIFDYVVWVSSVPLSRRDTEINLMSAPSLIVQASSFQVIPYSDLADMVRILRRELSPLYQCRQCHYSDRYRIPRYCGMGRAIFTPDCNGYQEVTA